MEEFEFFVTDITQVAVGKITKDKPFIPNFPRLHMSIVYILEGTLIYLSDRYNVKARSGDIFVVQDGEIDISASEGDYVKYIYIDFYCSSKPIFSDEGLKRINCPRDTEYFEGQFEKALDIWNGHIYSYKLYCTEILYSIVSHLIEESYQNTEAFYKYNKIKPAILKIETCYRENITLALLADICFMSQSNLIRVFAEITGKTPMEYLTHTRINQAKHLLHTGAYTITEIAEKCGYTDIYSFSRAFRRVCGVAPSKYGQIC